MKFDKTFLFSYVGKVKLKRLRKFGQPQVMEQVAPFGQTDYRKEKGIDGTDLAAKPDL